MTTAAMLTPQQAAQVAWAIEPMSDYWCTEAGSHERDGPLYRDSDLPRLDGRALTPSPVEEIMADLLYRLEIQVRDVASSEPHRKAKGGVTAALGAAERIRKAGNLDHIPYGGGYV